MSSASGMNTAGQFCLAAAAVSHSQTRPLPPDSVKSLYTFTSDVMP